MKIKLKIILGFISIGTLLLMSGLISFAELISFNRTAKDIMTKSQISIDFSKKMLDVIQEQNTSFMMSITDTSLFYDSIYISKNNQFKQLLAQVQVEIGRNSAIDLIIKREDEYQNVINQKKQTVKNDNTTSTYNITIDWLVFVYKESYNNLTQSIKEFMVLTQQQVLDSTIELENKAYRSSMVGIIALVAVTILMLLFYFLLNKFFIIPVIKINKELKQNLLYKTPYNVTIDTEDEFNELSSNISILINKNSTLIR